jgi:hypothetical protein
MGGVCSTHGKDEKRIKEFSQKTEARAHLGDLDVQYRIILKRLLNGKWAESWEGKGHRLTRQCTFVLRQTRLSD